MKITSKSRATTSTTTVRGRSFLLTLALSFLFLGAKAQNYFDLSTGNFTETFTGWTGPASGTNWSSVAVQTTGTIPSATRTTTATTTFNASTSASTGMQLGTGNVMFLSTGSTDNTTSIAFDLNLNFLNRVAGSLSFDAATVFNSTGNRVGSLRVYYTTNGTAWTEITGTNLPFVATNNVAQSATVNVTLPSALDGQSQVKLRFYYHNGSGGTTGSRPKISLDNVTVTSLPPGGCTTAPSSVSVAAASATACPGVGTLLSATVTPIENGQVYQWESSPDDMTYTPISGANAATYSATLSTTPLYYRMTAACGAGTPTVSTGVLITPILTTLPYSQGFAATTLPIADCWSLARGQLSTTTTLSTSATTWTADGWLNNGTTGAARVNILGTSMFQWLISPSFTLSGANKQVEFDMGLTAVGATTASTLGTDDLVAVVISTDNGVTWTSANILKQWNSTTIPALNNTGERFTIDLSAYANMSVRIGFYAQSTVSNQSTDLFVDNFVVQDIPLCSTPSILLASAGTQSNNANLSWTNPTNAPTSYEWIIVPTGSGTSGTPTASGIVAHPTNTTNTGLTLTASTTYDAYVRSVCSGGNSAWIGPTTFTTECTNATSISENFDGVTGGTNGTIPACWRRLTNGGSSYIQTSNAAPWSGFQRYIFIASTGQTPMAISPVIGNLNDTMQQLRFHTFVSSAGAGKTIQVGYMTDPTNAATFTLVKDITINNTAPDANWTIVKMPATAPASGYIAWRHPGTASYNLYFDDVFWEQVPQCGAVSGLAVSDVTTNSFKFSWNAPTSGTPVAYNYEIRSSGIGGSGISGLEFSGSVSGTRLDTTLTNMPSGRRYGVYVQADCGNGTTASWFGPIFVITLSSNDECASAIVAPVNADLAYASFITATTGGATLSAGNVCNPANTTNPNNDDVWFSFTAADVAHEIRFFSPFLGSPFTLDMVTAVYSGTCAALTQIDCQDAETFTTTGLTPGQTYYIRTFTKSATVTTIATQNFGIGTPPGMTYTTTTATQDVTTNVNVGASDVQIMRIDVVVNGATQALSLNELNLNTNGSTAFADIASAKIYYTGTSNTFSTATQFGATINAPTSSALNFTGSQILSGGGANTTNYFWLVYNVSCNAPVGNTLDAELESVNVGGTIYSSPNAPTGSRTITANNSYDTQAAGNWGTLATWSCGAPPTGTTATININHDVTVDVNVDINANINIAAGRKLTISTNNFKTGTTGGNNKAFTVNGILEVTGSTLAINGNLDFKTGSSLIMSAGQITIDPNDGTAANSVGNGTNILNVATNNFNMTGGKITIVDPNFNSTSVAFNYTGTAHVNLTGGTIAFGDGVSTTAGGAAFNISTFNLSSARFAFYNFEVNTLTGTNRNVTNTTGMAILNDCTILSGEINVTSGFNVAGNWINNGRFSSTSTVFLSRYASATATASTTAQTISGTGVFAGTLAGTNFTNLQVNNTNPAGVTFTNDITVSGTLTLAQGPVNINNITVGTSASAAGTITTSSVAGWINGTLTKWFTTATGTNTVMRVGTSTAARVATINFTTQALTAGGTLSAKFNAIAPSTAGLPMTQGTTSPVTIEAVSPTGYWTVTQGNGLTFNTNTAYTFTANASGFTEANGTTVLSNLSQIRLIKRENSTSPWLPIGSVNNPGSSITPSALTSVQAQSLKTFADFAIGGTNTAIGITMRLQAKVFLEAVDPATGLMENVITTSSTFPLSDPYSISPLNTSFIHVNNPTIATTTAQVLATTGNNAIVDWVFLELRQGTAGTTTVTQTRAALLQRDGDIVAMDGVSPVAFSGSTGTFYIAVRHRSHLGFRTASTYTLTTTPTVLDFTTGAVALNGSFPSTTVGTTPSVQALNGGDANYDGSVDSFDTITWEIENGLFDNYSLNSDYNMDGSVDAFDSIIWELNNGKFQELD
jgi:hypothetical protein